jgi:hypothetical protein
VRRVIAATRGVGSVESEEGEEEGTVSWSSGMRRLQ